MQQPVGAQVRLENLADVHVLYRVGINFIDLFCHSYATAPDAITLDIDDTDDLVHGGQQLALFNTHAGGRCFQPIHIFEGNSGKPILSLMRPGKRPSGAEIARVLLHVIHRIRRHWRHVEILVRGDGHYCAPEVLDLLHALTEADSLATGPSAWGDWKEGLVRELVVPNSSFSEELTTQERDRAAAAIEPILVKIAQAEVVVRNGTLLNAADLEKIDALGLGVSGPDTTSFAGWFVLADLLTNGV